MTEIPVWMACPMPGTSSRKNKRDSSYATWSRLSCSLEPTARYKGMIQHSRVFYHPHVWGFVLLKVGTQACGSEDYTKEDLAKHPSLRNHRTKKWVARLRNCQVSHEKRPPSETF